MGNQTMGRTCRLWHQHQSGKQLKKIAISQSNYIPWKGYFDLIASVDEFILFDDMQYTKRDWRNRNKIKTPKGPVWLSVPVQVKGKYYQSIRDTRINGDEWAQSHLRSMQLNYAKAPHFQEILDLIKPIYDGRISMLSELNHAFIVAICQYLGIDTKITNSWDYGVVDGKSERLLDLCQKAGADSYISGPAAKGYLDVELFEDAGMKVCWFDYDNYPEYPQLWGEFVHQVSIVDLLFNCGKDSSHRLKHVAPQ